LLHDVCKVNLYKQVRRGGDTTYEYSHMFPLGHGAKSVYIIQKYGTPLNEDEAMAIHFHMGAFTLAGSELWAYIDALKACPLVLLLHTADMMDVNLGTYNEGR